MIKILQIILLVIIALLMMSSSCDKGSEGCTDSTACNFDETAAIDDNSCWFASVDCNCNNPRGAQADCLGICDSNEENNPPESENGICNSTVIGGCIDPSNCEYNVENPATHNDGTCASTLEEFGGSKDGTDCDGVCGGTAVIDGCNLCVGGLTNLGQSWKIKITSITSFKHHIENDRIMGTDTNSVTLGASIYASDGYNGEEFTDSDTECENCYIDLAEPPLTFFGNEKDSSRFYFPHDDYEDLDGWGSLVNSDDITVLQFDSDIRANDYHSLFMEEKGMNWFAMIEPILSDTVIVDSIKFKFTYLEGIKCAVTKIYLDREKGEVNGGIEYVVENKQLGIKVDSDETINITINVSNICIQEFDELQESDESCSDGY